MYSVNCTPTLIIGKQGENNAEQIAVDFAPWVAEYGEGVISARLKRPKDSAAYPVVLTTEGTTATWTVSATDTQYAGAGSLQLVYIVGYVVAKSVIWPVRVLPSLEEGEAPEPYESWLDTLEGLAADTQGNARDAAASAADAAQSATSAAASAQDAAGSAASITGLTAVAQTLPEGSEASASFDSTTDTLTFGIPRGDTGATGPTGPAGPKGDTGADGFSPSASVTKQDGNIVITVTDKDGTTSETLEVDDALDETSENPVQNAAIVEAMRSMLPVDTASGSIASFPDGADNVPVESLVVQIEPIQEGSGDPSPDNVRPITGHTGVHVERTGGNIWDEEWESGQYNGNVNTGNITKAADNTRIRSKNDIPVKENTTYYVFAPQPLFAYFLDKDKNWMNRVGSNGTTLAKNASFTTPEGCAYIKFFTVNTAAYDKNISINYPSTDHEYHAYQGETIPVSWESEAGTVYGGTLDVVRGKLTVDRAMVESTWGAMPTTYVGDLYTNKNMQFGVDVLSGAINSITNIVSAYVESTTYQSAHYYVSENLDAAFISLPNSTPENTVVQVCAKLAQPIEYTLTPQEVRTFLGQNNIWNDVGDTEVMYKADIQKFIEKKVTS